MKVKVTWRNKNPFTPLIEHLDRVSEAELPEKTSFEDIEAFAIGATPDGYFLFEIDMPEYTVKYGYCDINNKKKIEKS
jgi:hypothetical protein